MTERDREHCIHPFLYFHTHIKAIDTTSVEIQEWVKTMFPVLFLPLFSFLYHFRINLNKLFVTSKYVGKGPASLPLKVRVFTSLGAYKNYTYIRTCKTLFPTFASFGLVTLSMSSQSTLSYGSISFVHKKPLSCLTLARTMDIDWISGYRHAWYVHAIQ